ncbi:hypothetical protein DAEQUDRAFT_95028 [Daedalea quercina L-15889]|uniref:Uncharacterized protein n=1 Tax=Daedalea quercina L-15889 TaxID=1314783 RepID=A0A165SA64_9APHY|nr:hypothetical protein DAEQUDRAFT_95028 [Daedalea quercina L-15889]
MRSQAGFKQPETGHPTSAVQYRGSISIRSRSRWLTFLFACRGVAAGGEEGGHTHPTPSTAAIRLYMPDHTMSCDLPNANARQLDPHSRGQGTSSSGRCTPRGTEDRSLCGPSLGRISISDGDGYLRYIGRYVFAGISVHGWARHSIRPMCARGGRHREALERDDRSKLLCSAIWVTPIPFVRPMGSWEPRQQPCGHPLPDHRRPAVWSLYSYRRRCDSPQFDTLTIIMQKELACTFWLASSRDNCRRGLLRYDLRHVSWLASQTVASSDTAVRLAGR